MLHCDGIGHGKSKDGLKGQIELQITEISDCVRICSTNCERSGGDQIEIRSDEIRVEVQQQQKYKFLEAVEPCPAVHPRC